MPLFCTSRQQVLALAVQSPAILPRPFRSNSARRWNRSVKPPQASKVIPSEILYRGLPCRCASRQAGARVLLVNLVFRWAAGLRDKAKLAAEPGDVEGAQVGAVQPHGAGERIVEAQQQLNDGALSAAAASHQRYGLARLPRGSF